MDRGAIDRLVTQGVAMLAGFTPTDAAHVLGDHDAWDRDAARKAASLLARRRTAAGSALAPTPEAASELVKAALIRRSAEAVFDAVLAHDGIEATPAARNALVRAAFGGHRGAARIDLGLALPLVGLGASAPLYYPGIAAMLGTPADLPADADVANAVGAVAGRIRITAQAVLTQPSEGLIRAHLPEGTQDFARLSDARAATAAHLRDHARQQAQAAGAGEPELAEDWEEKTATVENRKVFIEATLTVTATGRPRIAAG
jgi:N-methylhydantoinase A/oxoprolinase/acetone carboxylase beta subunit